MSGASPRSLDALATAAGVDPATGLQVVSATRLASVAFDPSLPLIILRGPVDIDCDLPLARGQELGWFEHGSTIVVFAPRGFVLAHGIAPGRRIRMGQALLRRAADGAR